MYHVARSLRRQQFQIAIVRFGSATAPQPAGVLRRLLSTSPSLQKQTDDSATAEGALASTAASASNPLTDVDLTELGVTVVRDRYSAKRALKILQELPKDRFHACDTEVAGEQTIECRHDWSTFVVAQPIS